MQITEDVWMYRKRASDTDIAELLAKARLRRALNRLEELKQCK